MYIVHPGLGVGVRGRPGARLSQDVEVEGEGDVTHHGDHVGHCQPWGSEGGRGGGGSSRSIRIYQFGPCDKCDLVGQYQSVSLSICIEY